MRWQPAGWAERRVFEVSPCVPATRCVLLNKLFNGVDMSRHLGFRAEDELLDATRQAAARSRIRVSDFIRQAVREKIEREGSHAEQTPYESGKDLFGRYGSGHSMLSTRAGERMRRRLRVRRESEET